MPISVKNLEIGAAYERTELAPLWGYKDWHAIARGVFCPQGQKLIVLFVTKENQKSLTQYINYFDGNLLNCEGEIGGQRDARIAGASAAGDALHLFFRNKDHMPFTYYGEVELIKHEKGSGRSPSKFVYSTARREILDEAAAATEQSTHGGASLDGDAEGDKKLRQHWVYERSQKNRNAALALQGRTCKVCGFNFDIVYGQDLANSYIEVHHIKSLAHLSGSVDPARDLIPLCSNCHSMAHRKRPEPFTPAELKIYIGKAKNSLK